MLGWAIAFFVAAIMVAVLGLAEAATTLAVIAKCIHDVLLALVDFLHIDRYRAGTDTVICPRRAR